MYVITYTTHSFTKLPSCGWCHSCWPRLVSPCLILFCFTPPLPPFPPRACCYTPRPKGSADPTLWQSNAMIAKRRRARRRKKTVKRTIIKEDIIPFELCTYRSFPNDPSSPLARTSTAISDGRVQPRFFGQEGHKQGVSTTRKSTTVKHILPRSHCLSPH